MLKWNLLIKILLINLLILGMSDNKFTTFRNEYNNKFGSLCNTVDNKVTAAVKASSSSRPFSPPVRPSEGAVQRADVVTGVLHAGHPPPEFADMPAREGTVLSTFTLSGSMCSHCRNIIPANFKGYCPNLFCPSNAQDDENDCDD